MPIEFIQEPQPTGSSGNSLFRLTMAYDGTGRRISKTRWVKSANSQDWEKELVTHYTGIGTEIRESFTGSNAETKVVVNMPNGLGRYGIEDAAAANANASKNFEWYLKNHLGSTMLVYGTVASTNPNEADIGARISAYDYRAFGEMVELTPPPTDKVTENFTGKEFDEEIKLNYFGARYLDPMLGMWISVDPKRQHFSPYMYGSNNPIIRFDPNGLEDVYLLRGSPYYESKNGEGYLKWDYDSWKERLTPAIEKIESKGYTVYIAPVRKKTIIRLLADSEAKRAFYMGHIRGNSSSGQPDALSTYSKKNGVIASQFGNLSNLSVELYLFGCNSKSLENSDWDALFPNITGNADQAIDSDINAEQFFKSVEDFADQLPQKDINSEH